jgi:hypothetical protein
MRVRGIVLKFALFLAAGPALAAPSGPAAIIIDRGLHRQWAVVTDDAHPERPPRLVEVPWSEARAQQGNSAVAQNTVHRDAPLVRSGMTVAVVGRSGNAEWHLRGTALEAGWNGDAVLVRAGLHAAARRGIVRGPALVEMVPGKAKN